MAGSAEESFDALIAYLSSIPSGPVENIAELERMLGACWEIFDGSDNEKTAGYKLIGRMEAVFWDPPKLTFSIERHGQTVNGSSRASLHHWLLDMDSKSASITKKGFRQLIKMQPRLDVKPLAQQVAELMFNHATDERIKWNSDGSVKVNIVKIIPDSSAATQTVIGRRKRFRNALNAIVAPRGWTVVRANVYRHPDT